MQVVIDANIVISMLIRPGKPIDLFFREELEIFAPELLFKELENNRATIQQKSFLSQDEIDRFLVILKRKITIIPEEDFIDCLDEAARICPDPKDEIYFALAMHLKCPIWTNEKGLQDQQSVSVYPTHELIKIFGI